MAEHEPAITPHTPNTPHTPHTPHTPDALHDTDFWKAPGIVELANSQGVSPLEDVRVLFGTWPGEPDDGFEAMIDALRHPGASRA